MTNRVKELIIKGTIVIGFSSIVLTVLLVPISCIFRLDVETVKPIMFSLYGLTFIAGVTFMVLAAVFKIDIEAVKAEKIVLPFDNFDLLANHITDSSKSYGYVQQPTISFDNEVTLTTYVKPSGLWKVDCIALVRIKELTNELLEPINNSITESLMVYYGKENITDIVNIITIFCVDRITPTFNKIVNSNIQQGMKNGRLPVGISFGGKFIYIAKQKDGFAIAKYKKLRKEFLKIMQIQV